MFSSIVVVPRTGLISCFVDCSPFFSPLSDALFPHAINTNSDANIVKNNSKYLLVIFSMVNNDFHFQLGL